MHISIHPDAIDDMQEIRNGDSNEKEAWADLHVFIEELKRNAWMQSKMLDHNFGKGNPKASFSISKWLDQFKQQNDLWRCKLISGFESAVDYRIVYAYTYARTPGTISILGVAHRSKINYDTPTVFTTRVINAYLNDIK